MKILISVFMCTFLTGNAEVMYKLSDNRTTIDEVHSTCKWPFVLARLNFTVDSYGNYVTNTSINLTESAWIGTAKASAVFNHVGCVQRNISIPEVKADGSVIGCYRACGAHRDSLFGVWNTSCVCDIGSEDSKHLYNCTSWCHGSMGTMCGDSDELFSLYKIVKDGGSKIIDRLSKGKNCVIAEYANKEWSYCKEKLDEICQPNELTNLASIAKKLFHPWIFEQQLWCFYSYVSHQTYRNVTDHTEHYLGRAVSSETEVELANKTKTGGNYTFFYVESNDEGVIVRKSNSTGLSSRKVLCQKEVVNTTRLTGRESNPRSKGYAIFIGIISLVMLVILGSTVAIVVILRRSKRQNGYRHNGIAFASNRHVIREVGRVCNTERKAHEASTCGSQSHDGTDNGRNPSPALSIDARIDRFINQGIAARPKVDNIQSLEDVDVKPPYPYAKPAKRKCTSLYKQKFEITGLEVETYQNKYLSKGNRNTYSNEVKENNAIQGSKTDTLQAYSLTGDEFNYGEYSYTCMNFDNDDENERVNTPDAKGIFQRTVLPSRKTKRVESVTLMNECFSLKITRMSSLGVDTRQRKENGGQRATPKKKSNEHGYHNVKPIEKYREDVCGVVKKEEELENVNDSTSKKNRIRHDYHVLEPIEIYRKDMHGFDNEKVKKKEMEDTIDSTTENKQSRHDFNVLEPSEINREGICDVGYEREKKEKMEDNVDFTTKRKRTRHDYHVLEPSEIHRDEHDVSHDGVIREGMCDDLFTITKKGRIRFDYHDYHNVSDSLAKHREVAHDVGYEGDKKNITDVFGNANEADQKEETEDGVYTTIKKKENRHDYYLLEPIEKCHDDVRCIAYEVDKKEETENDVYSTIKKKESLHDYYLLEPIEKYPDDVRCIAYGGDEEREMEDGVYTITKKKENRHDYHLLEPIEKYTDDVRCIAYGGDKKEEMEDGVYTITKKKESRHDYHLLEPIEKCQEDVRCIAYGGDKKEEMEEGVYTTINKTGSRHDHHPL